MCPIYRVFGTFLQSHGEFGLKIDVMTTFILVVQLQSYAMSLRGLSAPPTFRPSYNPKDLTMRDCISVRLGFSAPHVFWPIPLNENIFSLIELVVQTLLALEFQEWRFSIRAR